MRQRDPLRDPRPGDVVELGSDLQVHVTKRRGNLIWYLLRNESSGYGCNLRWWREWTASAKVVKRGK